MQKASKVKTPYNDQRSQWVSVAEYKEAKKTGGSIYASKDGSNPVSVEGVAPQLQRFTAHSPIDTSL